MFLSTEGVIKELDVLGCMLQEAFGVVGYHGPEDFDSIFASEDGSRIAL